MSDELPPAPSAPHSGRWKPGQSGNPGGRPKKKPFKEALEALIEKAGIETAAAALLAKANTGDVSALKELADRMDGKVPQAISGDDEGDPIKIETIRRIIVRPGNSDSGSIPPAADPK